MVKRTVAALILAVAGCSESTAPSTREPAQKQDVAEPPAIYVTLTDGAEAFFDDRHIVTGDGKTKLRIDEDMFLQLVAEAEKGNGKVQDLLGHLQAMGLTAEFSPRIDEMLCEWSERGFTAAYKHCARLLLTPIKGSAASQESLDRAMSYVRTLVGPKGLSSTYRNQISALFGDPKKECGDSSIALTCTPAWGELVTRFGSEISLYQRIDEAVALVRAGMEDFKCTKKCEEALRAFLRFATEPMSAAPAQLWLTNALHMPHSAPFRNTCGTA